MKNPPRFFKSPKTLCFYKHTSFVRLERGLSFEGSPKTGDKDYTRGHESTNKTRIGRGVSYKTWKHKRGGLQLYNWKGLNTREQQNKNLHGCSSAPWKLPVPLFGPLILSAICFATVQLPWKPLMGRCHGGCAKSDFPFISLAKRVLVGINLQKGKSPS